MKTFGFEMRYRDGGGARTDIVVAPDRHIALRIVALTIIGDNSWDTPVFGRDFTSFANLAQWLESEMEILYEWTDLEGRACPNCTSHDTKESDFLAFEMAKTMQCNSCNYWWAPLGPIEINRREQVSQNISDLGEWEAQHMRGGDE